MKAAKHAVLLLLICCLLLSLHNGTLTVPASMEQIGREAFLHCDSLAGIYFSGSAAAWAAVFFG